MTLALQGSPTGLLDKKNTALVFHLYLKRWGFLTPPVEGADFRAALEASCLRGACTGKVETGSNEGKKAMDPALALRLQLKFAPRPNSSAPAQELPESTKSPPLHRGTSSV